MICLFSSILDIATYSSNIIIFDPYRNFPLRIPKGHAKDLVQFNIFFNKIFKKKKKKQSTKATLDFLPNISGKFKPKVGVQK